MAGVDFGEGADKFTASVASGGSGGTIELHLDSKTGPVVGTLKVGDTGGWHEWQELSCNVAGASGEHDLYLVFNGGDGYLMNVDWWKFDGAGAGSSGTDNTYIFKNTFEGKLDGCTDRCGASVALSSDEAYEGSGSVYCSDRSSSWMGVGKKLNYKFKAGEKYSFSTIVKYNEGTASTKFHFTLQYTGSDDETYYEKIDTRIVKKGEWTQLANKSFKIPDGAKNPMIYVETEGDSDDDTPATNFYIDNLFAAVDGTVIEGPKSSGGSSDPQDTDLYPKVQTQVKDNKIGFKWTKVPGAEKYGIGVYQANKWVVKKQVDGSVTTWTSPKVAKGTYRMVVLAKVNGKWISADVFKKSFYVKV